jgi:hypothetical protein
MATVRKTLLQIRAAKPKIDRAKLRAITDADIARRIAEDPDTAPEISLGLKPVRRRLKTHIRHKPAR